MGFDGTISTQQPWLSLSLQVTESESERNSVSVTTNVVWFGSEQETFDFCILLGFKHLTGLVSPQVCL